MATDRPLYTDSSALVKLIVEEPETPALHALVAGRDLVSSELVLAEVPQAIWRLGKRRALSRELAGVLGAIALLPVDRQTLVAAGSFEDPFLRALDAIHVAAALSVADEVDALVTYDERQTRAARLAGLPVFAPA